MILRSAKFMVVGCIGLFFAAGLVTMATGQQSNSKQPANSKKKASQPKRRAVSANRGRFSVCRAARLLMAQRIGHCVVTLEDGVIKK